MKDLTGLSTKQTIAVAAIALISMWAYNAWSDK